MDHKIFNEADLILIDACIITDLFISGNTKIGEILENYSNTNKLIINQINLYEARYILKKKIEDKSFSVDNLLDNFIEDHFIQIYRNTDTDFVLASDVKASGGLSPYDALMIAQMQNSKKKIVLLTQDQEFQKFKEKYQIVFL